MSTYRRDNLHSIESAAQKYWESEKIYEANAGEGDEKYFCTFPYPYMNGKLHLGHAFSVSKAEFAARYQRMLGKNVLFPFAFHCTGMPIQAAANKLRRELELEASPEEVDVSMELEEDVREIDVGKFKGKKTKLAVKSGGATTKKILQMTGIPDEEIPEFTDPLHWLNYFPPRGKQDLQAFGMHIDWRRSFITTAENRYYDAFIRWHFNTLKKRNKLGFGKRPTVYSILDGQACADHDRSEGEKVGPQQYTLIKIKVIAPFPEHMSMLNGKDVYLVAATLRPETMYGQTNCFVLPDGEYGAFTMKNNEVFLCSERSVLNMSYQDLTPEHAKYEKICDFQGIQLMGLPLEAPNAEYDVVYTLPLLTISMNKGTGIVTSVPSDAPDDLAALRDLQKKPALREKYGITEAMVNFEPVPIIDIPGIGNLSAVWANEKYKVTSQNDKIQLKLAKEETYTKGFYEGIMLKGSTKGKRVEEAKLLVRAEMMEANQACLYYEPEKRVVSRSGDECIVAFIDQWFLKYGEESPEWQQEVMDHVTNNLNTYTPAAKKKFVETVGWLKSWACSRNFGLGTLLPWDPQFVIESLSDSTIYMSFYTIAHFLQEGVFDGSKGNVMNITPDQMSDVVFDYIYDQSEVYPEGCGISKENLDKMKNEFLYWYPMDLRVSGKDLIQNHLTMALYNHIAIWENKPEMWPVSYYTNGHIMVDAEKMSKSKGNFLMLRQCIDIWSADTVRFVLADAGDSLDDSNFERKNADRILMKLNIEEEFMKDGKDVEDRDPSNIFDRIFINSIKQHVADAQAGFSEMHFQKGLNAAWYMMQKSRDSYRDFCVKSGVSMSKAAIDKWKVTQVLLMTPIIPHWCEHVWRNIFGNTDSVVNQRFPEIESSDRTYDLMSSYLTKTLKRFRDIVTKKPKKKKNSGPPVPPTAAYIYVADEYPMWKQKLLSFLSSNVVDGALPKDIMKSLKGFIAGDEELKQNTKFAMQFAAFCIKEVPSAGAEEALAVSLPFDELSILKEMQSVLESEISLPVTILDASEESNPDPGNKMSTATPGKPAFYPYAA